MLMPLKKATSLGVPSGTALRAGAVVAVDVDDEGVVEPAHVLDGLDDAPDFVVAVGGVGGEDLHLPNEELLLLGGQLVPWFEDVIRPGLELGVGRDHAELLLVFEDLLTELVVALVEEMHGADLVDPLLGRMVRRVGGARRILDEERLRGHRLIHAIQVIDRVVGHAGDQVPLRFALEGIDLGGVAVEVRLPLVGIAADEAVEVLEAQAGRPFVERSRLAGGEGRGVVVLAEPRRGVAVVEQDPSDGGLVVRDDAVVTGEPRGLLGNHTKAHRVVVPSGDQRGARRRTECGRVDVVVAQTVLRDTVHRRRRNDAAEGRGHPEPGVIRDDEQDVGRTLGRYDARRPPRRRLQGVILDHAAERRLGRRQLLAADGGGGGRCADLAFGLLCGGRRDEGDAHDERHHCEYRYFFHGLTPPMF